MLEDNTFGVDGDHLNETNKAVTDSNVSGFIARSFAQSSGSEEAQKEIFLWAKSKGYLDVDPEKYSVDSFYQLPDGLRNLKPPFNHPHMNEDTVQESIMNVVEKFHQVVVSTENFDEHRQKEILDNAFFFIVGTHAKQLQKGLSNQEGKKRTNSEFARIIIHRQREPHPILEEFSQEMRNRYNIYLKATSLRDETEIRSQGLNPKLVNDVRVIQAFTS